MGIVTSFFSGSFETCPIASWEVLFFVLVIAGFSLTRRNEPTLVNIFTFTYYWGFKSLIYATPTPFAILDYAIVVYVICGISLFTLVHFSYLNKGSAPKLKLPSLTASPSH